MRVNVRQSPCTSRITCGRALRVSARPMSAAAPMYGSLATIASGRKSRISRRVRNGSSR